MNSMYGQQQQQGLPVPHNQVDQGTFNNNLPQGNDRVPQINMPKIFAGNSQAPLYAIGLFRKKIQEAHQRSPVHIVAYNVLSQNYFQNPFFQQWAQKAVDLTAIFIGRGGNPQQLLEQAVTMLAEAYMGAIWTAYKPALVQLVPQNLAQTLEQAAMRFNEVENIIRGAIQQQNQQQNYSQQGYMQPQQGYQQQGYAQQQQFSHASFANQVNQNINHGTTVSAGYQTQHTAQYNAPTVNTSSSGMYDTVQTTHQPVQEISGGVIHNNQSNTTIGQHYAEGNAMQSNTFTSQPDMHAEPEVEFIDVGDVVIDPDHYNTNVGHAVDRPYDLILLPNKMKVYPAFLNKDKSITHGDDNPYKVMFDPKVYCEFYVEYVDGVVKSKLQEWVPAMDYLQHELNDELKRRYRKPTDAIASVSSTPISKITDSVTRGVNEVKIAAALMAKDDIDLKDGLPTLVLDDIINYGASDLDNEEDIKRHIRELAESDVFDDVLPVHEYTTGKTYAMELSDSMADVLEVMATYLDYSLVAVCLKEKLRVGDISLRNFNFINTRLTDNVNEFLKDSLSSDLTIDDFCEDIDELLSYIKLKRSKRLYTVFSESVGRILYRSILLEDLESGYAIADRFVNLQTAWTLSDLIVGEFKKGDTRLLSSRVDKTLLDAIRAMIERNNKRHQYARMRLITTDGFYLEIVKGFLIDGAVLLKRL